MYGISKRSISPNVRVLALPIVAIVVVLILSVFILKEAYVRISTQNRELNNVKGKELVLQEKVETLRQLNSGNLDPGDKSLLALPVKNPGLWLLYNFRNQLVDKEGIEVTSMDSSRVEVAKEVADVDKLTLKMELNVADALELLTILTAIGNYAPFITFENVEFESQTEGYFEAKVDINLFWSKLPEVITSIQDPVNGLNSKEQEILNKIGGFILPEFSSLEAEEPLGRENPFN